MISQTTTATNQFDVARLARLNWEQDGCPPGREQEYYRMAESQIEALRNLLAYDGKTAVSRKAARPPSGPGLTNDTEMNQGEPAARPETMNETQAGHPG